MRVWRRKRKGFRESKGGGAEMTFFAGSMEVEGFGEVIHSKGFGMASLRGGSCR